MEKVLILIHGMGKHTAESFKKEIITALNNALSRYHSYSSIKFEEKVHVYSVSYDHIFEEQRKKMASSGNSLKEFINNGLNNANILNYIEDLNDIEADMGNNDFIHTHALDVIFYLTIIGERVRSYVAQEFLGIKKKYSTTSEFHILAHSLGTAVIHDTLNKLYTKEETTDTQLNISDHSIDSLWMIANVSDMITSISKLTNPYDSIVKPGGDGCVNKFNNVFHELDPITLKIFRRFDPPDNNSWITKDDYKLLYKKYKTTKVNKLNTHDVMGYLEDPDVCFDFFNHFFKFCPDQNEKSIGDSAFKDLFDEANRLKEFINSINFMGGFKEYIQTINKFIDFLR